MASGSGKWRSYNKMMGRNGSSARNRRAARKAKRESESYAELYDDNTLPF